MLIPLWGECEDGYEFFRTYCQHNHITINEDDPEFKFLDTQSINTLKVFDESGTEIQGVGACIRGMEDEGFEIDVFGIPYPFYAQEFALHREAYERNEV